MTRPRVFIVAPDGVTPEQVLRHAPGEFTENFAVMQLETPTDLRGSRQLHHLMADSLCVLVGHSTARIFQQEELELLSWTTLRVGGYVPTRVAYVRVPEPAKELQAMAGELQHFWTGITGCPDHGPWDSRVALECQECRIWERKNGS